MKTSALSTNTGAWERSLFVDVTFLKSLRACDEQVEVFAATFPNGCEVTKDSLDAAHRAGLNLEWFGKRAFGAAYDKATSKAQSALVAALHDARAAFDATLCDAWAAYDSAMSDARAAYGETGEAYDAARRGARAAHGEVMEKARATCAAATAEAWSVYHAAIVDAISSLVQPGRVHGNALCSSMFRS